MKIILTILFYCFLYPLSLVLKLFGKVYISNEYKNVFTKRGYIQAKYIPRLIFAIFWGFAFLHSILLWKMQAISFGDVISFLGLFVTFSFFTEMSSYSFKEIQLGIVSAGRILSILNTDDRLFLKSNGISKEITGKVTFHDVYFNYNPQNNCKILKK